MPLALTHKGSSFIPYGRAKFVHQPLTGRRSMDQATAHRMELLEAEIRDYRQRLRILAQAVLAGNYRDGRPESEPLAQAAMEYLGEA
jgi:hypothetical protein